MVPRWVLALIKVHVGDGKCMPRLKSFDAASSGQRRHPNHLHAAQAASSAGNRERIQLKLDTPYLLRLAMAVDTTGPGSARVDGTNHDNFRP